MWGIQWHYIQSGKCKTYGNPHKKLTKEEEKFWQNYIIRLYNEFLQTIWDNRKAELHTAYSGIIQIPEPLIDSTKVKQYLMQISDGRIYDAELAHVLGLVDKVFYLDEYVEYLKSRKFKVVDLDGLKFKP
jgi:ClpP class serine protease